MRYRLTRRLITCPMRDRLTVVDKSLALSHMFALWPISNCVLVSFSMT